MKHSACKVSYGIFTVDAVTDNRLSAHNGRNAFDGNISDLRHQKPASLTGVGHIGFLLIQVSLDRYRYWGQVQQWSLCGNVRWENGTPHHGNLWWYLHLPLRQCSAARIKLDTECQRVQRAFQQLWEQYAMACFMSRHQSYEFCYLVQSEKIMFLFTSIQICQIWEKAKGLLFSWVKFDE